MEDTLCNDIAVLIEASRRSQRDSTLSVYCLVLLARQSNSAVDSSCRCRCSRECGCGRHRLLCNIMRKRLRQSGCGKSLLHDSVYIGSYMHDYWLKDCARNVDYFGLWYNGLDLTTSTGMDKQASELCVRLQAAYDTHKRNLSSVSSVQGMRNHISNSLLKRVFGPTTTLAAARHTYETRVNKVGAHPASSIQYVTLSNGGCYTLYHAGPTVVEHEDE